MAQNSMMQSNSQQGAGSSSTAGHQTGVNLYVGEQNWETFLSMLKNDGSDGVSDMDDLYLDPIVDLPDLHPTDELLQKEEPGSSEHHQTGGHNTTANFLALQDNVSPVPALLIPHQTYDNGMVENSGPGLAKRKGKLAPSDNPAPKRSKKYQEKYAGLPSEMTSSESKLYGANTQVMIQDNGMNMVGNSGHGHAEKKGKSALSNTPGAKRCRVYWAKKKQKEIAKEEELERMSKANEGLREEKKQLRENLQKANQRADEFLQEIRASRKALAKNAEKEKHLENQTNLLYKMLESLQNEVQELKRERDILMLQIPGGKKAAAGEWRRIPLEDIEYILVNNVLHIKS